MDTIYQGYEFPKRTPSKARAYSLYSYGKITLDEYLEAAREEDSEFPGADLPPVMERIARRQEAQKEGV